MSKQGSRARRSTNKPCGNQKLKGNLRSRDLGAVSGLGFRAVNGAKAELRCEETGHNGTVHRGDWSSCRLH